MMGALLVRMRERTPSEWRLAMQQILVAVDFSACSRRALQAAIELSRAFAARLHVVHVTRDARHENAGAETILPVGARATPLERELVTRMATPDQMREARERAMAKSATYGKIFSKT